MFQSPYVLQLLFYVALGIIMKFLFQKVKQLSILKNSEKEKFVIEKNKNIEIENEFNLFATHNYPDSDWSKLVMNYNKVREHPNKFEKPPFSILQFLLKVFPKLEKIIPVIILVSLLIELFLGYRKCLIYIMEFNNYFIIGIVVVLVLSFRIPMQAYRIFFLEYSQEIKMKLWQVKLLYLLLHVSFYLRVWGFYYKEIHIVRWLFRKND